MGKQLNLVLVLLTTQETCLQFECLGRQSLTILSFMDISSFLKEPFYTMSRPMLLLLFFAANFCKKSMIDSTITTFTLSLVMPTFRHH